MPELPEVETTRAGLAPALMGARVLKAVVRDRRLRWPIAEDFEAAVTGAHIRSVERRAKYLLISFDHGTAIVHLGMSGSLRIVPAGSAPKPHDHWDLELDTGSTLRYHDPRRFGSLHWTTTETRTHPLLAALAPEPLSPAFDGDYVFKATRRRNVALKVFLMNSRMVVGVGNIYASEALFRAKLPPGRAARKLTRAHAAQLARAVKSVLSDAIRTGGTTLRDYLNADGLPGYFRQQLFVYERAGQPCRVCRTLIKQRTQAQRSTYWCPRCQKS